MNKIIVYEKCSYQGLQREFTSSIPSLLEVDFNNTIASLVVIGQPWIAYQKPMFKGEARVFEEGEYKQVDDGNTFSSLQLIRDDLKDPQITLFEHVNYGGRKKVIREETKLSLGDFSDRASSHKVDRGAWVLYEEADGGGRWFLARAGRDRPDYTLFGFNDRFSYLRPLKAGRPKVMSKVLWEKKMMEDERNVQIDELVGVNRSSYEQKFSVELAKEYESTTTQSFTFKEETSVEFGVSFTLDVSAGFFLADITIGAESNFEYFRSFAVEKGKSESLSKTEKTTIALPAVIPPCTKLTVRIMRKEACFRVPVELIITRGFHQQVEYGEYKCKLGQSIYADYAEEKI
ncbi:epidermal differentiation-specific protein-like [Latimeria chalumnae]|nr:PREDICTED: epidermal differentiation-specific protein-like [Latimeria chalumnae]|eukprot:XP_006012680.1 PREDICTED: epidermal differentiation-specific protein-like [Latimeria chalumnae]